MDSVVALSDPALLALRDIEVDETLSLIAVFAMTLSREAMYSLCQQASGKVHSRYMRTLADLSCFGQRICWLVQVRRFFCQNAPCKRRIFAERIVTCAAVSARRMRRQAEMLCQMAFALGGKGGEHINGLLGMATSHHTLLRLIEHTRDLDVSPPRILGVDDSAWKKEIAMERFLLILRNIS